MELAMAVQAHGRTLGAASLAFPAHAAVGQSWILALHQACDGAAAAVARLPRSAHRSSGIALPVGPNPPK
ncbi:hypothetical protein ACGFZP_39125 [Kitasatospora sp. NPDC048239]|uniref:hypothetical protein n=1 Tax=Kitasatospora sp. NPDC048239 TaxID=3364046 RepID=UPI003717E5FD